LLRRENETEEETIAGRRRARPVGCSEMG